MYRTLALLLRLVVGGAAFAAATVLWLRGPADLRVLAQIVLLGLVVGIAAGLVSLVTVLQVGAAIGLSIVLYAMVGLGASDAGKWDLPFLLAMLVLVLLAAILLGLVVWLIGWAGALFGGRPRPGIKPLLMAILFAFASCVVAFLAMLGFISRGGNGGLIMTALPVVGVMVGYRLFTRSAARAISEIARA